MTHSQRQPISVVIPSYNNLGLVRHNLPAVLNCLSSGDEVVIVEDAGRDETVAWLTITYDLKAASTSGDYDVWQGNVVHKNQRLRLVVILNHHNLRFGKTANRGVELAHHDQIFLLNNDVSPAPDVLQHLVPHFSDPKVFAVGCLEHEEIQPGESPKISGKNEIWFSRGLFMHSRADEFNSGDTAWVSGGSGLFDRRKWLELDGFDPAYYPAYWEDIDLSWRARERGWKVLFEARAQVTHHHESTHETVFGQEKITQISLRNARIFAWKHSNLWQKMQFLIWQPYYWWVHRTGL